MKRKVDAKIRDTVKRFNEAGFRTTYSCAGHLNKEFIQVYVAFLLPRGKIAYLLKTAYDCLDQEIWDTCLSLQVHKLQSDQDNCDAVNLRIPITGKNKRIKIQAARRYFNKLSNTLWGGF
jgi:hypothetical protein